MRDVMLIFSRPSSPFIENTNFSAQPPPPPQLKTIIISVQRKVMSILVNQLSDESVQLINEHVKDSQRNSHSEPDNDDDNVDDDDEDDYSGGGGDAL